MLKKAICAAAFVGVFTIVSLTSDTAHAWRRRPVVVQPQPVVWVQPQPVWVQPQPVFVQRPVMVAPRRVYRPVYVW